MGKKLNWSETQEAARSQSMKDAWNAKRMSEGKRKVLDGAGVRKELARRDMKAAWAMRKARVLLKIGKFQIIWG